jgi:hypothetical protein
VLYPGETIRLLRDLPESGLPRYFEASVAGVCRNEQGEVTTVEIQFYRDSHLMKAQVALEAVELVVASSSLEQTAVLWEIEKPPEKLMEAAMHSMLDSGFLMRDGLNVARLHYDRDERWWKWGEKLVDATGAQVVAASSAWDGCVVAFSGRQRFHLEFRMQGRRGPVMMLHERTSTYLEQARSTAPAMALLRILAGLCGAARAGYCAFPVASPWLLDEDWKSLLRPPLYPDLLLMPENELPAGVSAPFRVMKLTGERAILTTLPVKGSPTEIGFERSERDLKLDYLRKCNALGEKYYDQMYETRFGTTGLYSDAKDAFRDAIAATNELGLKAEAETLEKRLEHIKAVFRSQF